MGKSQIRYHSQIW